MDQCTHCIVRGDMGKCMQSTCSSHENWWGQEMIAKVADLEAKLEKRTNQRNAALLRAKTAEDSTASCGLAILRIAGAWGNLYRELRATGDRRIDTLLNTANGATTP